MRPYNPSVILYLIHVDGYANKNEKSGDENLDRFIWPDHQITRKFKAHIIFARLGP